jgi:NitT/TauT family transport system substrate-binding protein
MPQNLRHGSDLALVLILAIAFCTAWASTAKSAEKSDKPVAVRLDFIIGGKHAPWFVAAEKGFYSKRGLSVNIQPGTGSADTVRAVGAGIADVGFADITTAIVARSRGTPVLVVAQLGYMPTTIIWREDTNIKNLKDLEGKSWAISPGHAPPPL